MFGFRYPAVVLLACIIAGTMLGRGFDPGLPIIVALMILAACFLLYGFIRLPGSFFIIPLAVLTIASAFLNSNRAYVSMPGNNIGNYIDSRRRLEFFGEIVKWPILRRHKTIVICRVDSISHGGIMETVSGQVLVNIARETTHFALGDKISFGGRLQKPFGGGYPGQFDYARHLRDRGISGTVFISDPAYVMIRQSQDNLTGKSIAKIRRWIVACFHENLTDMPAALASGFLIGETHDIPDDVYLAFRRTGTMHLLAVSGSNVALVLVVVAVVLRYVPLRRTVRFGLMMTVIIVFSHLSYNQPSVVRASIMAALILTARACYRRNDMHNVIALAAVILIFYDPANLYDIGFQLSFAVTWGLILFLPQINTLIENRNAPRFMRYLLLIVFSSLIATLISAPITAFYFGEVSLVTVFSNLLIVPMVSAAVIGIAVLLLMNLAFPVLTILPGILLDRLLNLILQVVTWFDQWQFAAVSTPALPALYVYLFLIGTAVFMLAISYRVMRKVLIGVILAMAVYLGTDFIMAGEDSVADLEIFNLHDTQTIISNRGEGAVIFNQSGDSRRECFSADLLPYLFRRNVKMPRYFIFMEPRYQTEQRLAAIDDKGFDIDLWPYRISLNDNEPSIWTSVWPDTSKCADLFHVSAGIIIMRFGDSGDILFASNAETLDSLPANRIKIISRYILPISDQSEWIRVTGRRDIGKAVILISRSLEKMVDLADSAAFKTGFPVVLTSDKNSAYLVLAHTDNE